jgi:hypothetical protein
MRVDREGTDIGTVSVEIDNTNIVAGRVFCMKVIYTAGPKGVSAGGSIRFKLPGMVLKENEKAPVTCSNPEANIRCSNILPEVKGRDGREFFTINYLFVTLEREGLKQGDKVTVKYGDEFWDKPEMRAPNLAQPRHVEVAVDTDGSRSAPGSGFYLVNDLPVLNFINDKPFYMEITIPSYTVLDQPFKAFVKVRDRYHNLVTDYTGKVTLLRGDMKKPESLEICTFTPEDEGVHIFENVSFDRTGINRIIAMDKAETLYARSNPSRTSESGPENRLFWGDTHVHSVISADSAANSTFIPRPEGDYEYARYRSGLDFCTVTDHIEDQSQEDWKETREAAKKCYQPGEFVTFSGFEATFQPSRKSGDKNVYFFNDDEEWVNRGTTQELYENLKARKSRLMVIPHVHQKTNWDLHDPELERVVEIYSHWGLGLFPGNDPPIVPGNKRPDQTYVSYALEKGAKLGFIASADHSLGHPGDDFWWKLSSYNGGLAAVFAGELTREGIWDGLWNRRCYATTRARILLEFEVNGHFMGEGFTVEKSKDSSRSLKIGAYGTACIEKIEIIRNMKILESRPGNGSDMEFEFVDPAGERETDYYFIHVVQRDGEQAWSSPVWVRVGPG